jgi:hypothetical protein
MNAVFRLVNIVLGNISQDLNLVMCGIGVFFDVFDDFNGIILLVMYAFKDFSERALSQKINDLCILIQSRVISN